jgi:hypothetical protein
MIIKMITYLLILFGVVGFFLQSDNLVPTTQNANVIYVLALDIVSLPCWEKLLSNNYWFRMVCGK